MITLKSYACGAWHTGTGEGRTLRHAVTGEPIATADSGGLDFAATLEYGRRVGGPALRALTFPERGELLKEMVSVLKEHVAEFYDIAFTYGATRRDAWVDVEGGIGALAFYSSLGRKQLPASTFLTDGEVEGLSRKGTFVGRHVWVPLEGVAVQINAYNFPSWGMLEKLGPGLLAGMPALVKPATPSAWLAYRMVEALVEAGVLPEGTLQLICGGVGDLLDHLTCQDVLCFTGSAATGHKLRAHPNVVRRAVRFNMEADSLNAIVLGGDVAPGSPAFAAFVREIVQEMTAKAGQKCTAIRRILVPREREGAVIEALREALGGVRVGDPAAEGVGMGPLVSREAREAARQGIAALAEEAEIVHGDPDRGRFEGVPGDAGAFLEPVLLKVRDAATARAVHEVEVFGPVATVVPYADVEGAVELVRRGGGSLVSTLYTEDEELAGQLTFALAPYHGRLMVMNAAAAAESTGHGIAMPHLVHGGPGRAGGGEELGGARSLDHYMQRVALQGSPERLEALAAPETRG